MDLPWAQPSLPIFGRQQNLLLGDGRPVRVRNYAVMMDWSGSKAEIMSAPAVC